MSARNPWGRLSKASLARRRRAAYVVSLAALAVTLPLVYLGQPLHVDESTFLVVGAEIAGGTIPYVGIADHKPPAIFLVAAALTRLPPEPHLAARLLVAVAHVASAALVFALGRRLRSPSVGMVASLVHFVGAYLPHFDGFLFLTEPFSVLAILAATYLLLDGRPSAQFGAGLALAVGVLFNQTTFLFGLVVLGWYAARLRDPARRADLRSFLRDTARDYAVVGAGFLLPLALTLALAASVGAMDALLRYSVVVPLTEYDPGFDLRGHVLAALSLLPVWMLALAGVAGVAARWRANRHDEGAVLVALWFLVLVYPGATSFAADHKLLFALPAAALLATAAAASAARSLAAWRSDPSTGAASAGRVRAVVAVGLVVSLGVFGVAAGVNAVYAYELADDDIGDQRERVAAVDGEVYTLPFRNEVPYFGEDVEPVGTFVGHTYAPTLSRDVVTALERDEIEYVVVPEGHVAADGTVSASTGYFTASRAIVVDYVNANYERETTAGGYVVYRRADAT